MIVLKNFKISVENQRDKETIELLLDNLFGIQRYKRTVYKFRNRLPVKNLCLVLKSTENNNEYLKILASIRFWPINFGRIKGLLLGPLAVRKELQGLGYGKLLVKNSIAIAKKENWKICFASGEYNYFKRFGFVKILPKNLILPGYIEPQRLLINYIEKKVKSELGNPPWKLDKYRELLN